jgi:hypothetical protein
VLSAAAGSWPLRDYSFTEEDGCVLFPASICHEIERETFELSRNRRLECDAI